MKIAVLGGGDSPERDISLKSSYAVTDALKEAGYEVIFIDPKEGIDQLYKLEKNTIVFPILHGAGGEDGVIQAQLEKLQIPYLGTMSEASKICFDKALTLTKLSEAGIPIAEGGVVDEEGYWSHELIKKPHVLKVASGGSSIGTYIARDPLNIDKKIISEIFSLDDKAIIEELLEGVEITIPIFDTSALPVIEINPPKDQDFDYENKYNGLTEEICPPGSIDEKKQAEARALAEKVHKVLGARHMSRVDIIVGNNGRMAVLELNTIPGMTRASLYPKSAAVAGMPMAELVRKFVGLVSRDYNIIHE